MHVSFDNSFHHNLQSTVKGLFGITDQAIYHRVAALFNKNNYYGLINELLENGNCKKKASLSSI